MLWVTSVALVNHVAGGLLQICCISVMQVIRNCKSWKLRMLCGVFGNILAIKRVENKNKEGSRRGVQMAVVGLVSLYFSQKQIPPCFFR